MIQHYGRRAHLQSPDGVTITRDTSISNSTLGQTITITATPEPLAGATFQVMNEDGFIVAETTTGEDGTVAFENLVYGSYTYKESKAPDGYLLDESVYDFSITEDGQTITHTRDNCRIPGSISVRKTNSSNQPLSGATYLLEYSLDKGKTWTPVFTRDDDNVTEGGCTSPNLKDGQLTTGSDGTVTFTGLRADENVRYRLTRPKPRMATPSWPTASTRALSLWNRRSPCSMTSLPPFGTVSSPIFP